MSSPVAVVTGGSSGIGLALVKHLVSQKWRVVIADLNPPKESIHDTIFIRTDISSWEQQVTLFKEAYAWGRRLDFAALNAGLDDQDDIFSSLSHDINTPPSKPNTNVFSVNVVGTYYGVKLAAHYMALPSHDGGKARPGGKIVLTVSGGGLFPIPPIPQYTASKHALIGLTRALGASRAALAENIRINAVCPAIVNTAGLPNSLVDKLPADQFTPMSTIVRCFDAVAELESASKEDWVELGRSGETVEGNGDQLIWHYPPTKPPGEGGQFNRSKGVLIVAQAYEERKRQAIAMEGLGIDS